MAEKITAAPWEMPYPTSNGEVKLGATNMQEISERATAIFKERYLTLAEHGASFTAQSGELVKAIATITVTLPPPALNATVGVICASGETTIKMTGPQIFGDFITGAESIKLALYQHVILQSDGTHWFIIAGEPKRASGYGAETERAPATPFEPSATRPTLVVATVTMPEKLVSAGAEFFVEGVKIARSPGIGLGGGDASVEVPLTFIVPAGKKWEWVKVGATATNVFTSYLTL